MSYPTISRNPDGVVADKPIALRLLPGELDQARDLAGKLGLSYGALARRAYLKGLPLLLAEHEKGSTA